MIRILLVDDHPVVREGLVAMLSTQSDMEVVAQAGTGAEALALQRQCTPDVTLVDLHLPDMEGSEVIKRAKQDNPDARFLVITAYETDDHVVRAMKAGARGYVLKGIPKQHLFDAVRTVYGGGALLGPGVAPKLLGIVDSLGTNRISDLTERELEVLKLASDGMRNKDIASRLSVSERTVKFHLTTVFQKLRVSNRTEAVKEATRRGLISM